MADLPCKAGGLTNSASGHSLGLSNPVEQPLVGWRGGKRAFDGSDEINAEPGGGPILQPGGLDVKLARWGYLADAER